MDRLLIADPELAELNAITDAEDNDDVDADVASHDENVDDVDAGDHLPDANDLIMDDSTDGEDNVSVNLYEALDDDVVADATADEKDRFRKLYYMGKQKNCNDLNDNVND